MKTICAISTPRGVGGIGVIRVSGESAIEICEKIVFPGRPLHEIESGRTVFARVKDNGQTVDEIMVSVFRGPHCFTGEDTVELSCHGGMYILNRVITLLLRAGCAPAAAGEFTKRAFLNGKMDLTQAEAVIDLIHADSRLQASGALRQMDGLLGRKMNAVRDCLIEVNTEIMAYVDYPEETIGEIDEVSIKRRLTESAVQLSRIASSFERGQVIRDGIATVITGRPNVGKSTLMNLLLQRDKSIVTDTAGTTRDLVEDRAVLGDMVLHLTDTAGIHETGDKVEQIGVARARDAARSAQLVLLVTDVSRPLTEEDFEIFELCRDKCTVLIANKTDCGEVADLSKVPFEHIVPMSAKREQGLEILTETVRTLFLGEAFDEEETLLTNQRQRAAVLSALESVQAAAAAISAGFTPDLVSVDIENAAQALGELTGQNVREQMIEDIFSRFCVGK